MDLSGMLRRGVAIVVATAGEDGRPSLTRGWGPTYDEDTRVMRLTVTAPTGSPTLTNLESNGAIAVTVSEPLTYATAQLKGVVDHVGALSESDRVAAHEHLARFADDVAQIGIAEGADLFGGDLRSVSFEVEMVYDQTPGGRAGSRLR